MSEEKQYSKKSLFKREEDQKRQETRLGKSWFLGIGINEYRHYEKLKNAVKDVKDVLALLEERYEIDEKIILFDEAATRKKIINQLEYLNDKVKAQDKLIIYYSGHGCLIKNNCYWIPVDAEKPERGLYILIQEILQRIKSSDAKHILLICDSCFSGNLIQRDITTNEDNAFEQFEKDKSRWALCSGRGTEKVADGEPGENSPFAKSILKVLSDNQEPKLNVSVLSDKVTKLINYDWEQKPEGSPLSGVGHEGGQYVFRLKTDREKVEKNAASNQPDKIENKEQKSRRLTLWGILIFLGALLLYFLFFFKLPSFDIKRNDSLEPDPYIIKSLDSVTSNPEFLPTKTKSPKSREIIDSEGNKYRTINISGKEWIVENLRLAIESESWCYDNYRIHCDSFGRLYTWEAAKEACSKLGPGWRLPNDSEWKDLIGLYEIMGNDSSGINKTAYKALKDGGWSGLNLKPGGMRILEGTYDGISVWGYYWTNSSAGANFKNGEKLRFQLGKENIEQGPRNPSLGFSCRCIKG